MDDNDMVFVGSPGGEPENGVEVLEDFVDLRVGSTPEPVKPSDRTPVLQYLANFHRLFGTPGTDARLRDLAFSYQLSPGGFRSLCWSFWLNLFPGCDPGEWVNGWLQRREIYKTYKDRHCHDNRCDPSFDPSVNNPLSQADESPWNVYFKNTELKKEIERDVVRTCPGNDTFKEEAVRTMMINILFIYCKEHKNLSYRQGMHEILGSLLLVWKADVETCKRMLKTSPINFSSVTSDKYIPILSKLFEENFIEHDIYFIFEKVMDHMWDWYYTPDRSLSSRQLKQMSKQPEAPFLHPGEVDDHSHCNAIRRLRNMWTNILQLHDQDLFDHLEALGVLPTTFGINWTKLLFSRQFKAYLSLWDAIFASKFTLVDYLVVALVLSIRQMLMGGDSNQCNSLLVARYPTNVRVDFVISMALYLQDSFNFCKPRGSPFQLPREEKPAANLTPLKNCDDPDESVAGSFDFLSREECNPRCSPADVGLRDTFETVDASLNELRHVLQQQTPPVSTNVFNAFQRLEANLQAMNRQLFSRPDRPFLRRNNYSVAFDALGWADCDTTKSKR